MKQKEELHRVQADLRNKANEVQNPGVISGLHGIPTKFMAAVKPLTALQPVPDMDTPWMIYDWAELTALKGTMGETLSNFAAKYPRDEALTREGKVSWPLWPRTGGHEADMVWTRVLAGLGKPVLDISSLAPNWPRTTWLYGLAESSTHAGLNPNSASTFKSLLFGSVQCIMMEIDSLLLALAKGSGWKPANLDELVAFTKVSGTNMQNCFLQ